MNRQQLTEELLQHLSGTPNETGDRILRDLHRRSSIDTHRPMEEMQQRIEEKHHR